MNLYDASFYVLCFVLAVVAYTWPRDPRPPAVVVVPE